MELYSIASGSSGNCIYIGSDKTKLLMDVGISGKRVENGLSDIHASAASLDGILISHEHSDHISGLGVMARRYHVPIYATPKTIQALMNNKSIGNVPEELFHAVKPDQTFEIKDMEVTPFSISHDAADPVCYTFHSCGHKIGIATDLGKYDDYIIENLNGCEVLLLEANHDVNMLQVGAYPYYLKKRILGDHGHLSNDNSGKLICRLLGGKLRQVFLGHLSRENNFPELAYETVKVEIENFDKNEFEHLALHVAKRDAPSGFVTI